MKPATVFTIILLSGFILGLFFGWIVGGARSSHAFKPQLDSLEAYKRTIPVTHRAISAKTGTIHYLQGDGRYKVGDRVFATVSGVIAKHGEVNVETFYIIPEPQN